MRNPPIILEPTDINASRFWAKVETRGADECWSWRGEIGQNGYGRFKVKSRHRVTHRVSYTLANGPIPEGLFVCHACDNRSCVNPAHLWLGTNADNMADAARKGRMARKDDRRGEANPRAKLTEADVRLIRNNVVLTRAELSARLGVSGATITQARTGATWPHVR